MSGTSSGGFVHGALIGGGVVFFVAGMIIVAGIPGGIIGTPAGGMSNGTTAATTTEITQTSTQGTQTTAEQSTTELPQSTTQSPQTTPSTTTPSTTTTTTSQSTTTATVKESVLYRVNVGGQRIPMSDDGPDWTRDTERRPSQFGNARKSGSHTNATKDQITTTPAVPSGTPEAVFQSRRYDADNAGDWADNTEMQYRFPAERGKYVVRLYFIESYFGNSEWNDYEEKGPRKFDVEIEGKRVLNDYDMYEELGHDRGTVKTFTVKPKDGTINVRFLHEVEDPMLSGIEIVRVDEGKENGQNSNGKWNDDDRDENDNQDEGDDSDWDGWGAISSPDSTLALSDSTFETPTLDVRPTVAHEFPVSAASRSL